MIFFPVSASALLASCQDTVVNRVSDIAVSLTTQCFFFVCLFIYPSLQIRELVPESQAYMDLLAFERKLDQTIMRKRVDIQEALKRPMKVSPDKNIWIAPLLLHSVLAITVTDIFL